MFQVGQKVVGIRDDPPSNGSAAYMPCRIHLGCIYTVRGIHIKRGIDGYGVYLEEIVNPLVIWSDNTEVEWSFSSTRFQPLVEPQAITTVQTAEPLIDR